MKEQIAKIMDEELFAEDPTCETSAEFIDRICHLYLNELEKQNGFAIPYFAESVIEEIQDEAICVFRAKIYGHYSIMHFRQMLLARKAS